MSQVLLLRASLPLDSWDPLDMVVFLLCLQKVVEEEKQEHVDKVKELLGWASGLRQSVQGRTAAARSSRELGDIEKSISEQQVSTEPSLSISDQCTLHVPVLVSRRYSASRRAFLHL